MILGVLSTVVAGILQFSPNKVTVPVNGNDTVRFREFSDFREEVREGFREVKEELQHLRERS